MTRFAYFVAAGVVACTAVLEAGERSRVQLQGVYYPDGYYSQKYLQPFLVPPGVKVQRPVLVPYQHYGRHRLGEAFPPLASGHVDSDRFPYRYQADFVAVPVRRPVLPDPCDVEERLRRQDTYPPPFVPPLPIPHNLDVQSLQR
jgi:hypothetical protein